MSQAKTTKEKVEFLLEMQAYNKKTLCEEMGISFPTLLTRLTKDNWKKAERTHVDRIFTRIWQGKD